MPKHRRRATLSEWGLFFWGLCDYLGIDQKWVEDTANIPESTLSSSLSIQRKELPYSIVYRTIQALEQHPGWGELVESIPEIRHAAYNVAGKCTPEETRQGVRTMQSFLLAVKVAQRRRPINYSVRPARKRPVSQKNGPAIS